jgi:molecular chaperone GrpE
MMDEKPNPFLEPEPVADTPDIPPLEGLDGLSGPAAFKAKQKAAEQTSDASANTAAKDSELSQKITQLEADLAKANDNLIRTLADMENLRKRSIREREDAGKFAISNFARDLLDVADTFGRALSSIPPELRADDKMNNFVQGIEATERSLLNCFEKNGIRKIEPLDEPFNPHFHEVMFEAAVAGKPSGMIIQVIEPGYVLNERLLRPARVGVAKATSADGTTHVVDTQA